MTFWLWTYAVAGLAPAPSWSQLAPVRVQLCVRFRSVQWGTPAKAGSPGFLVLSSISWIRSAPRSDTGESLCSVTHKAPQNITKNTVTRASSSLCRGLILQEHPPPTSGAVAPVGRISGAWKVRNWETSQGQQSMLLVHLLHCLTIPFPTQASCTYLSAFPPKEPTFQNILRHQGKKATWPNTRSIISRSILLKQMSSAFIQECTHYFLIW